MTVCLELKKKSASSHKTPTSVRIQPSIHHHFLANTLLSVGISLVSPALSKNWSPAGDTSSPPCSPHHSLSFFSGVPLVPVTNIPWRHWSKHLTWLLCNSYSQARLPELFLLLLAPSTSQKNLLLRSGRNKDSPSFCPRNKSSIVLAYLQSCLLSSFLCVQSLNWAYKIRIFLSPGHT